MNSSFLCWHRPQIHHDNKRNLSSLNQLQRRSRHGRHYLAELQHNRALHLGSCTHQRSRSQRCRVETHLRGQHISRRHRFLGADVFGAMACGHRASALRGRLTVKKIPEVIKKQLPGDWKRTLAGLHLKILPMRQLVIPQFYWPRSRYNYHSGNY